MDSTWDVLCVAIQARLWLTLRFRLRVSLKVTLEVRLRLSLRFGLSIKVEVLWGRGPSLDRAAPGLRLGSRVMMVQVRLWSAPTSTDLHPHRGSHQGHRPTMPEGIKARVR